MKYQPHCTTTNHATAQHSTPHQTTKSMKGIVTHTVSSSTSVVGESCSCIAVKLSMLACAFQGLALRMGGGDPAGVGGVQLEAMRAADNAAAALFAAAANSASVLLSSMMERGRSESS